jgi:hypothetical protein
VAGDFYVIHGHAKNSLAAIRHDGQLAASPAVYLPGSVLHAEELADDGLIVCGLFLAVDGVPRSHVAKIRPDGTLDPDWAPRADGLVGDCVADGRGGVILGGQFTKVGGQPRAHLARVTEAGDGALDERWDPRADEAVSRLAMVGGDVIAGGDFQHVKGDRQPGLVRVPVLGDGTPVPGWKPLPQDAFTFPSAVAMGLSPDKTTLYASGFLGLLPTGSPARAGVVRTLGKIDVATGQLDNAWVADLFDGVATYEHASSIAVSPVDGAVYVGGSFSRAGGQRRQALAKFSGTGTGEVDPAWNPGAALGIAWAYTLDLVDGQLYVGGFGALDPHTGTSRGAILARASATDGAIDRDWRPSVDDNPGAGVLGLTLGRRRLLVTGFYQTLGGSRRVGLAALPRP